MAPKNTFTVRDTELRAALKKIGDAPDALQPTFLKFAQYMRVQTDNTFHTLRHGGSYRGVSWKYFAPQYTRNDGTVVPAWGGVAKLSGNGQVLGRLRPSGARIARGDSIMQDTMTMRSRAALVVRMDRYKATLGVQGVNYAPIQHAMRPFLFFASKDGGVLNEMLRAYVRGKGL